MWTIAILVFVPYLAFSFSYPFMVNDCSYITGECNLRDNEVTAFVLFSFRVSYYSWWILAPLGLLCGLVDAIIGVVRQVRNA